MPNLRIRLFAEPALEGEVEVVVETLGGMTLARLEAGPELAARLGLNAESHTGLAWTGPDEATVVRRARAWLARKASILDG